MKCGECPVATTNPKDKTDCYFCPFDKVDAFHSLHDCSHLSELVEKMAELLNEQEPKTPIHIHEEYPEHDWETDKDGNIDEFAMDYGFHNGPACKRCGYSFCEHCKPNGWNEEPCVIDYYQCPKCGNSMCKGFENIVYCKKCGQAVKWND